MFGATVRCADMDQTTVDAAVWMNVTDPCLRAVRQLSEPTTEDVVLGQSGELGVDRGQGFEHRIVDHRPLGLFRSLLRAPAARLKQGPDLDSRIEVFHRRELRAQLRRERGAPRLPILAQLHGCGSIEGCTVCGHSITDSGDVVLELERRAGVTVRL